MHALHRFVLLLLVAQFALVFRSHLLQFGGQSHHLLLLLLSQRLRLLIGRAPVVTFGFNASQLDLQLVVASVCFGKSFLRLMQLV